MREAQGRGDDDHAERKTDRRCQQEAPAEPNPPASNRTTFNSACDSLWPSSGATRVV